MVSGYPNLWDESKISNLRSLGYFIGAMKGDGWYSVKYRRVDLGVKDREFAEAFAKAAIAIGLKPNCHWNQVQKYKDPKASGMIFHKISMSSATFTKWLASNGYVKFYDDKEFQRGFISGMFDAEGTAVIVRGKRKYKHTDMTWVDDPLLSPSWRTNFSNTDLSLLTLTKKFLENFGFTKFTIYKHGTNTIGRTQLLRGRPIRKIKQGYVLQSCGPEIIRPFLLFVDAAIPRKRLEALDAKLESFHFKYIPKPKILKLKVPLDYVREQFFVNHQSLTDIGRKLNVHPSTIANWLNLGDWFKTHENPRWRNHEAPFPLSDVRYAVDVQGKTMTDMAIKYHTTRQTIARWLGNRPIMPTRKHVSLKGPRKLTMPLQEIRNAVERDGKQVNEIARELHVDRHTVSRWLKQDVSSW